MVGGGREVARAKDAIAKGGNTARGRDRFHQKDEEEGGPFGGWGGGFPLSSGVGGGGEEVGIGGGHFTVAPVGYYRLPGLPPKGVNGE